MSNEELVAAIQAGEDRWLELWNNIKGYVIWRARYVMSSLRDAATIELDDLIQSGYIALTAAVETYAPEKGAFSTWLVFYLKTAFEEETGIRTKKARRDPLHYAKSLDAPIDGDEESDTFGELIPDPSADIEILEERLWREELRRAIDEVLEKLPEEQRAAVTLHYLEGLSLKEGAEALSLPLDRFTAEVRKGLDKLHNPATRARLRSFFDFDYYHGTNLRAFEHTGVSIQERYLIQKEKASEPPQNR